MEIGVIRIGSMLVPMDEFQAQEMALIPEHKPLAVIIDSKRNMQNHKRFFAFLNTALDTQDHYQNIDQLRFALFIKAGLCERVISHKSGAVSFIPQSMNFSKMGEEKFKKVFKVCIDTFHIMLQEMNIRYTEEQLYKLMDFE